MDRIYNKTPILHQNPGCCTAALTSLLTTQHDPYALHLLQHGQYLSLLFFGSPTNRILRERPPPNADSSAGKSLVRIKVCKVSDFTLGTGQWAISMLSCIASIYMSALYCSGSRTLSRKCKFSVETFARIQAMEFQWYNCQCGLPFAASILDSLQLRLTTTCIRKM